MATFQLDKLDRRILTELDDDARQPLSKLSRTLRQGRDRVQYRINRLLDKKIIRRFTVSINVYKLGLGIYKTYLRLENNRQRVQELHAHLRSHPRVFWVAVADGSWDLMFSCYADNSAEFYEIQSAVLSQFSDITLEFTSYSLVDVRMYKKNYFLGDGEGYLFLGDRDRLALEPTEYRILKILGKDARIPFSELAEKSKTTSSIARGVIQRLESTGIIVGYGIEVDLPRLGLSYFKAQLYLRDNSAHLLAGFCSYCDRHPYITQFIRQVGDSSMELEFTVRDYPHYSSIIEEIRANFSGLIRNFHTIMIQKSHRDWIPRSLPEISV